MADTSETIVAMLLEMRAEMLSSFQEFMEKLAAVDQRLAALVTEQQAIAQALVERHSRLRATHER